MKISAEKAFNLLNEVVMISNSTLHIDKRLTSILEQISSALPLKCIALYILDTEKEEANLKSSLDGTFKESLIITGTPFEDCAKEHRHLRLDPDSEYLKLFVHMEDDTDTGETLLFPVADDRFFYGIMMIMLNKEEALSEEDISIIKPVTTEIAGTIRNAQLYANSREMVEELVTLNDVWKTMSSTIKLDSLLEMTIEKAAAALKADIGVIRLQEGVVGEQSVLFHNVTGEGQKGLLLSICAEICNNMSKSMEPTVIKDLAGRFGNELAGLHTAVNSAMAAPIIDRDIHVGCIILFGRSGGDKFGDKDLRVLSTIASQISAVIDNALLLEKMEIMNSEKEVMMRELSDLFELNKAIMATIDLDKLLHIILTAVTIGEGFGFNRAMLFLYNENTGYIQGMMGVGPDSAEDAWKIWSEISEKRRSLQEILEEEGQEAAHSRLTDMVKGMRVSVEDKSILGLTVKEKRSFNVTEALNDPRTNVELLSMLNCRAFATVPLMASGRVVGVIMVDNIFNNRPITDDDIRLLTIFANQAGVAIENSLLYRDLERAHSELRETQSRLIHSEKLAALGEMAAGVAHEIRNPLVSIGGFARRLSRAIEEDCEEGRYVDIICSEVERLENILNDILIFSREETSEPELQNINNIINDSLQFFWNDFEKCRIQVHKELQEGLDMVEANKQRLKQVFINLFANARHAMKDGGSLRIISSETRYEGEDYITVEVIDTGGGIPYDIINNIFNPFFTTKDDGTGLGLAITHKILSLYGGDIEVINNKDGGATFFIKMPISRKK